MRYVQYDYSASGLPLDTWAATSLTTLLPAGPTGPTGNLTGPTGVTGPSVTGPTGAGGTFTRGVPSGSTATSLPTNSTGSITITGYKSYILLKIQTSCESWIRIYSDNAARTADSTRTLGTDPLSGSGVIAEVVTTAGFLTQLVTPGLIGFNNDSPVTTNVYIAATNLNSIAQIVTVTLTLIQMEN